MDSSPLNSNSITAIRKARDEAEAMRDRLMAEYDYMSNQEDADFFKKQIGPKRFKKGREAMRKAIVSVNRAIACINQAISQNERAQEDF